ncbi:MAG: NADH-quinone oxidoreductase subunit J [Bdellovibrionia bacterium]
MMGWVFAGITLSAVLMATFVSHVRQAILALWVAGLGVGAMYLTVGAEFLAIIQWIVSTVVTISFVFFSVMFGEYNPPKPAAKGENILMVVLSLLLGAAFAAVIWLGSGGLPESALVPAGAVTDLALVGRKLTQENLLSLEVLALTLFLVLVGGGVIARSEKRG